jgi:hypothetical protein
VKSINAKYADYDPIELWERSVPLHERVALYQLADCVLVTATRDGMNLVPYEYVACRNGHEGASSPSSPLAERGPDRCSPWRGSSKTSRGTTSAATVLDRS